MKKEQKRKWSKEI